MARHQRNLNATPYARLFHVLDLRPTALKQAGSIFIFQAVLRMQLKSLVGLVLTIFIVVHIIDIIVYNACPIRLRIARRNQFEKY